MQAERRFRDDAAKKIKGTKSICALLLDRLGNPLGRVHAGRPTNLREE